MNESVFQATDLCLNFKKKTVLDQLSIDVARGEVTVLLGPNGVGKTTLFRMALGLLAPTSGSLIVNGADPMVNPRKLRQRTGFVPSVPDPYPWMTVADLYRYLKPQYPTWDDLHADQLIESLGVPRDTTFANLSRGEGMKAMLAAALAPSPELLLLDEPFSGLDPVAREDVLRGVISSLRGEGRTVVCATHDLDVAARIADQVAILRSGTVTAHGTLDKIMPPRQKEHSISRRLQDLLVGGGKQS